MVGAAVKTIAVPSQAGLSEVEITTLAGRLALTVMVTSLEVAGLPWAHGEALEVSTTEILSLFSRVDEV